MQMHARDLIPGTAGSSTVTLNWIKLTAVRLRMDIIQFGECEKQ